MNVNLSRQIIDNGKVYAWVDGIGFSGWVLSPIQPKTARPYLDWDGGKIPLDVWQRVLAFFKAHADNEVQVRLYYNLATKEWRPWAFPQEYPSGMTTKELPEHPNTAEDARQFEDPNWLRLGSVHHHCNVNAFQSGTDSADEATVPGLHITMGNLRDPKWSMHTRVSMRIPGRMEGDTVLYGPTQMFYDAALTQWFDLPDDWKRILPGPVQTEALKLMLVTPPDGDYPYPVRWKDNLVRRVYPNGPNGSHVHHAPYRPQVSSGNGTRSYPAASGGGGWEKLTAEKLNLIGDMIEVYKDEADKFLCQCVETYKWREHGFHNRIACEGVLRSCGLEQVSEFVWCFPQDKDLVTKTHQEIAQREAQAEFNANLEQEQLALSRGLD
jgi:hypothetical protein